MISCPPLILLQNLLTARISSSPSGPFALVYFPAGCTVALYSILGLAFSAQI
ncbi:hypothetical protein K525DRAFT_256146 [Schizophyllum commune Loenen D]|nr:hypothetical protein K525DRAFT_256146 [Schizophyllum commune Loenen D]